MKEGNEHKDYSRPKAKKLYITRIQDTEHSQSFLIN